jgi:hypothetical protein
MAANPSEFTSETEARLPATSYFGNVGRNADVEENVINPSAVGARDEDLDVAFWNIEWFNTNVDNKVRGVARFVADMNLDVWGLEETSPRATERLVRLLWDAYGLDFDFDSSEPDSPDSKQSTTVMWNRATVGGSKRAWPDEIEQVLRLSSQDDLTPVEELEEIEEAIHGRIFDRYPALFHLSAKKNPSFDFFLVPLHLKAMAEGSLRRQLASRVLAAAVNKMIHDGEDADWILGGDINAPLASGDFDQLSNAGLVAVSKQDAADGAFSYIKGPKSLIDHIYLSPNLAAGFNGADFSQKFSVISAEKEIPDYVDTISDHRPVMLRLHIEEPVEEGVVAPVSFKTPEWVKRALPTSA